MPEDAPTLAELKALCLKETEAPISRWVYRRVSIPVTWLLVRTPATPNQVTFASALFGLVAVWAVATPWQGRWWLPVAGLLLFQWAIVLDHVDGEVARAKRMGSPAGYYFDNFVMEVLLHLAWAAALVLAVYGQTSAARWLGWGAVFVGLKALNLVNYYLKGVVTLKAPAEDGGGASAGSDDAAGASVQHVVASRWWEVKKMVNLTSLLLMADLVLLYRGVLPVVYEGMPFTLTGAYVAVGIPLLALSLLLDVWNAARGRYQVDLEPYK